MNAKHPLGVRLNALGHVAVGLAHLVPSDHQMMRRFMDSERQFVGLMSDHPLIVLDARNGHQLHLAHMEATKIGLVSNVFVIDMKDGEPIEQQIAVAAEPQADHDYVAFGCWGDTVTLRGITRRFSLLK